jgi:hypothetical protein
LGSEAKKRNGEIVQYPRRLRPSGVDASFRESGSCRRTEYLAAENEILRGKVAGRLQLSRCERVRLAKLGKRLGLKALKDVAAIVKPETILGWYRKLVAAKFDGSEMRRKGGRAGRRRSAAPGCSLRDRAGTGRRAHPPPGSYDHLTGLANRALFRDALERALGRAERSREPLALIFIDIDRFKAINDTLGHATGDKVLRSVADRLGSVTRRGDTVGRIGGDSSERPPPRRSPPRRRTRRSGGKGPRR